MSISSYNKKLLINGGERILIPDRHFLTPVVALYYSATTEQVIIYNKTINISLLSTRADVRLSLLQIKIEINVNDEKNGY